tara:strand:+ start:7 stop:453 length:447 start_codon:yes stop_codon:yes gene_type:complete
MGAIGIKIDSGDLLKLNNKIKQLKKLSTQDLSKNIAHAAIFIQNDAILNAPHDTGDLRQSIGSEAQGNKAVIYANINYAAFQEFGTGSKVNVKDAEKLGIPGAEIQRLFKGAGNRKVNINPQPYFFPAVRKGLYRLLKNIERDIKKIL